MISVILALKDDSKIVNNILAQTYTQFELLIHNKNGLILPKDNRIREITLPLTTDKDIYNYLIYKSNGDVICVFKDSYIYSLDRIQKQYSYYNKNDCVMLGTAIEKRLYKDYVCQYNDSVVYSMVNNSNKVFEGTEMFDKKIFEELQGYTTNSYAWVYNKFLVNNGYYLQNMREVLAKEK